MGSAVHGKPAVLYAFEEQADLGRRLARRLDWAYRAIEVHGFPDGESRVRLRGSPAGRPAAVLRSLDDPNRKVLEALLALDAATREGASHCLLVAPYIGYMRQDASFRPGEAVSQAVVGRLLGLHAERIVTVDLHLHRTPNLWAIFRRAGTNLHAGPLFAPRLRGLRDPLVLGPDGESRPWVTALARVARVEGACAGKRRLGDDRVAIVLPARVHVAGRDVVILDDIVSTGQTVARLAAHVLRRRPRSVRLFVTHALFVGDAEERLRGAGLCEIVSSNSLAHETNGVDIVPMLADAIRDLRLGVS